MIIKASLRPQGIKHEVSTKKLYSEGYGYKGGDPDVRDVVGRLDLNAVERQETLLLASLFRLFSHYDIGGEHRMAIFDKDGKEIVSWTKVAKSEGEAKP